MRRILRTLCFIGLGLLAGNALAARAAQEEKIAAAIEVMQQAVRLPEQNIPPRLLHNAQGIAIIPNVIKAGFMVGGSYGKGVLLVRDEHGQWAPPLFIALAAGSFGWQIGAQSTDVVLVFKGRRGIEGIVRGTFTLGADAAIAAGPVGRRGEAATDAELKAEILSYSRSRGLFAGISLEGSNMAIDHEANEAYYGKVVWPADILAGKAGTPASAQSLIEAVRKATHRE